MPASAGSRSPRSPSSTVSAEPQTARRAQRLFIHFTHHQGAIMKDMPRRQFVLGLGSAGAGLVLAGVAPIVRAAPIKPDAKSALIVVDVQNCFVTGGTLPVKGGE